MTTSEVSPVSDLSRRSVLLGGAAGAAALVLGHAGTATAAPRAEPPQLDFDFDTDNFIEFLQPSDENAGVSPSAALFAPMDVTIFLYINHLTTIGWFDAVAPYHPTAVGVYSRVRRRPSSESATNRNMNIALIHSSYQVVKGAVPERLPAVRQLLTALGLNPDDESTDPTSPVGIGNRAGKAVIRARAHDGMNLLGDEGRRYNFRPFTDHTGYQPVNTAYELVHPSRWQPQLTPHRRRLGAGVGDKGIFAVQHFVSPQMRVTKPYTYRDVRRFHIAPPDHTDHTRPRDYKRSVDEILDASAALTDKQKVMAEVFDNKVWGIGHSTIFNARRRDLDVHGWAHLFLTHLMATYDPLPAVWHQKTKYDAVRPFSAIRHVYGHRRVTSWGGPGMGTVHDMPADEWASYLNVGDHPEYPSGSTTLCSAEAQSTRRFFGDDVLDWRFTVRAGSTLVEPGISPARDVELHWPTWTAFVEDCASSRVWGGVHFRKTVQRTVGFGEQFGDLAYEFVQRQVRGDVRD